MEIGIDRVYLVSNCFVTNGTTEAIEHLPL